MTRFAIAAALALAVTLPTESAQALAPRTFVSAAGSDSNPCSFALPCRHFQAAVDATSDGGEVDALDPAGYSPITISRGITIEGQGWSYIAPPANGAAILINAVSGKVVIRGVSLNGVGVTNAIGIQFNSGASLNVQNSVIENFTRYGILFQPNAASKISILNTQVSDNNYGIYIGPLGTGTTNGVLDHVHTDNNTNDGISAISATNINLTVTESVSANNGGIGIIVNSQGVTTNVVVRDTTIANNGGVGLDNEGFAVIAVSRSTITGNTGHGWVNNGHILYSYGDNINDLNTADHGDTPVSIQYR